MFSAGALIFVYKLLVMNNYTGLRNGLHGGSELVLLNRLASVWLPQFRHVSCLRSALTFLVALYVYTAMHLNCYRYLTCC